ncbi:MAG: lipoate--protein ligase [Synergistaceae bacterium]|nr:lipoate--protein ligase [Synergistaceae bacterium]
MYSIEEHDTRPQHNLALEEYLCRLAERERGNGFFMLWQNEPSIIVGRFQNTLGEIDPDFVQERGIHVVRRRSGGGAVYHDLGNVNYSFIGPDRGDLSFALLTTPILRALAALGVTTELSGRNDVTIDGKKISGGAQYRHGGVLLHHGTLLFDSDLDALSRALRPQKDKFESKGVASLRSRVTNIRPHLPPGAQIETARDLMTMIARHIEGLTPRQLTDDDRAEVRRLMAEKYETWDWNYGASPPFKERKVARFPWGGVEALIDVAGGVVRGCSFYGDWFGVADHAPLVERIVGVPYAREAIREALMGLETGEMFSGSSVDDITELLMPDV